MEGVPENDRGQLRVANAPCSWGLIGKGDPGIGWERMLDELAAAGYEGTELGDYGFLPVDPARLKEELEKRQLALLGAFAGVNLRRPGAATEERERLLTLVRLLAEGAPGGAEPYLVLADADGLDPVRSLNAGRITADMGMSEAEWGVFLGNSGEIARLVLEEVGLRTVFHPHGAGFVETPEEIGRFLEGTAELPIDLVFDTGHYVYGTGRHDADGLTALHGLRQFRERIRYVHFKDLDPGIAARARSGRWNYLAAVRAGLYPELGRGSIDFRALVDELGRDGYRGWITVEQDVLPGMGTPYESALRNREYLATLGL